MKWFRTLFSDFRHEELQKLITKTMQMYNMCTILYFLVQHLSNHHIFTLLYMKKSLGTIEQRSPILLVAINFQSVPNENSLRTRIGPWLCILISSKRALFLPILFICDVTNEVYFHISMNWIMKILVYGKLQYF